MPEVSRSKLIETMLMAASLLGVVFFTFEVNYVGSSRTLRECFLATYLLLILCALVAFVDFRRILRRRSFNWWAGGLCITFSLLVGWVVIPLLWGEFDLNLGSVLGQTWERWVKATTTDTLRPILINELWVVLGVQSIFTTIGLGFYRVAGFSESRQSHPPDADSTGKHSRPATPLLHGGPDVAGETSATNNAGTSRAEYSKRLQDLMRDRKELADTLAGYPPIPPDKMTTQELRMRRRLTDLEFDIAQLREDYSLGVLESLEASTERLLESSTNLVHATSRVLESSKSLEWLTSLVLVITMLGVLVATRDFVPLFWSVVMGLSIIGVFLLLIIYNRRRQKP
jgi:hypothetical protein